MIHDLTLRWVVSALFTLSAAECGIAIVTQRRPWTLVLGHGLHFAMAVAMAVMAWPRGARIPATGPAVFFLLAAVWFVTMAVVASGPPALRSLRGYHGLMMLATAWMYAIMSDHLLPVRSSIQQPTQPDMAMPAQDMAGMNMPTSGASSLWFSAVNWIGMVGFAVAAVFWTYRYSMERRHHATRSRSLGTLGQAIMAAGMAIMFRAALSQV
ncbi:DUF5134 domain-containing protein [Mycobacterium lacus]|uniref:Uncharacterized protein n=1 Tax=Mycobacterium lacus TaxID=169765 RepID=A0A1X1XW05_9MYCO|nr:DUF5134 domain-containing protein [Mycobacterium lacus]MCV7124682.1 DUF5134 domain-containing protein [Mycobacterium lacus]ORW03043.1 hypothetical protein AWC15_05820 [Mycobacterium lacus]BBX95512.1 hypothetical protein MLAC_08060 [Mycobacterium lacus]